MLAVRILCGRWLGNGGREASCCCVVTSAFGGRGSGYKAWNGCSPSATAGGRGGRPVAWRGVGYGCGRWTRIGEIDGGPCLLQHVQECRSGELFRLYNTTGSRVVDGWRRGDDAACGVVVRLPVWEGAMCTHGGGWRYGWKRADGSPLDSWTGLVIFSPCTLSLAPSSGRAWCLVLGAWVVSRQGIRYGRRPGSYAELASTVSRFTVSSVLFALGILARWYIGLPMPASPSLLVLLPSPPSSARPACSTPISLHLLCCWTPATTKHPPITHTTPRRWE